MKFHLFIALLFVMVAANLYIQAPDCLYISYVASLTVSLNGYIRL
jgi:hypothetical protein